MPKKSYIWRKKTFFEKQTKAFPLRGNGKGAAWIGGDAYTAPVVAVKQGSNIQYFYLLRDYLGNITHVVDASYSVTAEFSYDAWGRRRNATDWHYTLSGEPDLFAGRGFTGHEYLPYFNLYNMNGRLYDPVVGRFLSPDNYVQLPDFTQSYNRYSYALNNPLKYVDPSGHTWLDDFFRWIKKNTWDAFWTFLNGDDPDGDGIYTGGLNEKVPNWVPDFNVGVNSNDGFYYQIGQGNPRVYTGSTYDPAQNVNKAINNARSLEPAKINLSGNMPVAPQIRDWIVYLEANQYKSQWGKNYNLKNIVDFDTYNIGWFGNLMRDFGWYGNGMNGDFIKGATFYGKGSKNQVSWKILSLQSTNYFEPSFNSGYISYTSFDRNNLRWRVYNQNQKGIMTLEFSTIELYNMYIKYLKKRK